jgi:riboflavin biosynthesis pyrimidine reductase
MLRLIRSLTVRQILTEQVPALAGAAILAERFYKFHSFLLECGAFLMTWFVLDAVIQACGYLLMKARPHRA